MVVVCVLYFIQRKILTCMCFVFTDMVMLVNHHLIPPMVISETEYNYQISVSYVL